MERKAYVMSLTLHGAVLALMLLNFNFAREYSKPPSVILHIDLNKVQISDKTNLPQKVVPIKKEAPKPVPKSKENPKEMPVAVQPKPLPKPQPKPQPKPTPKPAPEPKPVEPVKNSVPLKEEPIQQPTPKTEPKTQPKIEPKVEEDDLQSLLATVEKVRQQPVRQPEMVQNDLASDTGNTGLEGRLDQMLSISEKDFISSKLRECWNINGGMQDLDEILVEVKAYVNKDGTIRDVQILNRQNYPAFQSVAESAKRAVYICASKGSDSPFYILSQKYADHYGDWKEIYLRFSPLEGVY